MSFLFHEDLKNDQYLIQNPGFYMITLILLVYAARCAMYLMEIGSIYCILCLGLILDGWKSFNLFSYTKHELTSYSLCLKNTHNIYCDNWEGKYSLSGMGWHPIQVVPHLVPRVPYRISGT